MQFIKEADWNYTVTVSDEGCHLTKKVMGHMTKISMGSNTGIRVMGLMTSANVITVPNGLHDGIIFKCQNRVGK